MNCTFSHVMGQLNNCLKYIYFVLNVEKICILKEASTPGVKEAAKKFLVSVLFGGKTDILLARVLLQTSSFSINNTHSSFKWIPLYLTRVFQKPSFDYIL